MAKQGRRDFNNPAWSPAGRDSFTRALARRIQRIERAPVHIDIPTVKAPKKASTIVGATSGAHTPISEIANRSFTLEETGDATSGVFTVGLVHFPAILLLSVMSYIAGGSPAIPTITSDLPLTWKRLRSTTFHSGEVRLSMFLAEVTEEVAFIGSTDVTVDYAGVTQNGIVAFADEALDGDSTSVIQKGFIANSTPDGAIVIPFNRPTLASSFLYASAGMFPISGFPLLVGQDGFDELLVLFPGPDGRGLGTQKRDPATSESSVSWSMSPDAWGAGIALELAGP